jgi:hypothetical protein
MSDLAGTAEANPLPVTENDAVHRLTARLATLDLDPPTVEILTAVLTADLDPTTHEVPK